MIADRNVVELNRGRRGARMQAALENMRVPNKSFRDNIVRAVSFAADPLVGLRHRSAFSRYLADRPGLNTISDEKGFALFAPGDLPGVGALVDRCNALFEMRVNDERTNKKDHLRNLLEDSDPVEYPEILDFVLSDPVIEAAAGYLKTVPRLASIGLWWTPANQTTTSSQLFHCDSLAPRHVRVLVNINDLTRDTGPFSFIPADVTEGVADALHYEIGRLTDEQVFAHCNSDELLEGAGAAGSVLMVDTKRCLHYGGRTREGYRLVFQFLFTPAYSWREDRQAIRMVDEARFRGDVIRRMALGLK